MREEKKKEEAKEVSLPPRHRPSISSPLATAEKVQLAATALTLNVRPRAADMPGAMQERAFRCARAVVDAASSRRPNLTLIAQALKKEFDGAYGPAWHCVVGWNFGSFVTHSGGGFLYFSLEEDQEEGKGKLSILLFQTRLRTL